MLKLHPMFELGFKSKYIYFHKKTAQIIIFMLFLQRCPYVNLYKNEVSELLKNNLPSQAICTLLRQCEQKETTQLVEQEIDPADTDNQMTGIDDLVLNNDFRFKCGIHPRNWCDNLQVTRRCNAFNYCLSGWAKSGVKYDVKPISDESLTLTSKDEVMSQKTCGFCVFIFNKLQSVLQQNATQVI